MTIKVQINPDRLLADSKFTVENPLNGRPFPDGVFDMDDDTARHPRVLRLFPRAGLPGGRDGGKFGDLMVVTVPPATSKKG